MISRVFDHQLFRFLVVGAMNTIVGYLIYAGLLWLGLGYAAAAGLGTILGVLFNFKSTGRLVFGSSNNQLLLKFVGVYAFVYVFNVTGLWVLTQRGLSAYVAGLVTLLPAATLGFILNKVFVFRSPA